MNTIEQILSLRLPGLDEPAARTLCYLIGTGERLHLTYRDTGDFLDAVHARIPGLCVDDCVLSLVYESFLGVKDRFNNELKKFGFKEHEIRLLDRQTEFRKDTDTGDILRSFGSEFWKKVEAVTRNYAAVDRFAEYLGIRNDPNRYLNIISCIMRKAEEDGVCCVDATRFLNEFRNSSLAIEADRLQSVCGSDFIVDHGAVYRKRTLEAETACAEKIAGMIRHTHTRPVKIDIAGIEETLNKQLNDEQSECVRMIGSSGVKVITGGAGTGKTSVIAAIICAAEQNALKVQVCATTGKAAQQVAKYLADVGISEKVSTVHHAFKIDPKDSVLHAQRSCTADILIIDESSMLNLAVFAAVLEKTSTDATVILVGDANQIPPVQGGNVFGDLTESGLIPVVRLKTTYRQSGDSGIILRNAERILAGDPNLETDDHFKRHSISSKTPLQQIVKQYFSNDSAMILCPVYDGQIGISSLNSEISQILEDRDHERDFRVGDRVITNTSGYDFPFEYSSGEIGRIDCATDSVVTVGCDTGHTIVIPATNISDLDYAYAISIHKSQGSEFDEVIIVLPAEAKNFINRKLLYTAVTRAKRKVTIFAAKSVLKQAIQKKGPEQSGQLTERIQKWLSANTQEAN